MNIRLMTTADLAAGRALSEQAGWNQTEQDWRRCLALRPDACFVAQDDDGVIGTATACLLGRVAWVAMVLVDPRWRRRGVGEALMRRVLTWADELGVPTVRLDATPMGQPLYERLGFSVQFRLVRYAGVPSVGQAFQPDLQADPAWAVADVVPVPAEVWPALAALDEAVTRTDRRLLLSQLFAERPQEVHGVHGDGGWLGYMTTRAGRLAVQLGPCVGQAGPALLADAARRHAGRLVFLDVPQENQPAIALAEGWGLTVQRHLTRMCRGEPVVERLEHLFGSSGPEKG